MRTFKSRLAPVIKEYLEFRKTLGYSGRQENDLALFDAYCLEYYPDIETLTKESVRGWVNYEITRGCGSMYKGVSAVRMLAQYMGNGAYILPAKATPIQPQRKMPYILTDDELTRLFAAADSIEKGPGVSIKRMIPTLLRLLYTCGLRPTEVRLIKRDNINFNTGEIFLEKTKGHKERVIVMSNDMLELCRKYDVIRTVENPQSKYFFVRNDTPISAKLLYNAFNSCWQQANPSVPMNMLPKVRPYDLRHRFASAVLQKWLNEGRDLYAMLPYLRAYMGHEEFSHTAYYIHLLPENLLNSTGVDWNTIDAVNPEVSVWKS